MIKAIKASIKDIPKVSEIETFGFKFWKAKFKKEETEKGVRHIACGFDIDKIKFIECLYQLGFRRYDIDNTHYFIQIVNQKVVRQVSKIKIQDYFFAQLKEHYKESDELASGVYLEDLINFIYNRLNNLFADELLYRLIPKEPIIFSKDTKTEKFIYFENGFIQVTASQIAFKDYSHLHGYIWENLILKKTYKQADAKEAVFSLFIKKVCSIKATSGYEYTTTRVSSLMSIIGYNLHSFTETKLKATVLTDSRISNDDEPNGRTGKTLFCKAIGKVVSSDIESTSSTSYCEINGKDFDPTNKNKYQMASLDTKIIVLNDLRRGFNFEVLFNDITEGITVERKNLQPYKIFAKIIATTNKTIKLDGSSSKDRAIEFEFGDYFNEGRSPQDEFGHWFFSDWDEKEWSRFFDYMAQCCKVYLSKGLIKPEIINLNQRKVRENTSVEFIEFFESPELIEKVRHSINFDEWINKTDLFNDFVAIYPDFQKLTRRKFAAWIDYYCKYSDKGLIIADRKALGRDGHCLKFKYK